MAKVKNDFFKISLVMLVIVLGIFGQISSAIKGAFAENAITYTITYESGLKAGDIFDLTVTVENEGTTAISTQTVRLYAPAFIGLLEDGSLTFDEIAAGSKSSKTVKALALEGGSESVYLLNSEGERIVTQEIRILGKGYYGGDGHTHSVYSDGAGTVTENALSSVEKGLDFIFATDHSKLGQKAEVKNFNTTNVNASNFVCITGDEVSMSTHGLAYDITKDPTSSSNDTWEIAAQKINEQGGFLYYAHPFAKDFVYTEYDLYEITEMFHGVEVVNGNDAMAQYNLDAKDYWDKINTRGGKHYYGMGNTDGHVVSIIGAIYNKGMLEELTSDNATNMLKSGKYWFGNGTDLRFEMAGKGMGETVYVNGKEKTSLHIEASNRYNKINKVVVYGFKVNGTLEVDKSVVFEQELDTEYFSKDIEIELVPDMFYRMEAYSDISYSTTVKGFAYSNPIWVEKAEQSNVVNYGTYSCDSLIYNEWHGKYINLGAEDTFNSSLFTVTGGTTNTVEYKTGGNNRAGKLIVTYTAQDGSKVKDTIYVIDAESFVKKDVVEADKPEVIEITGYTKPEDKVVDFGTEHGLPTTIAVTVNDGTVDAAVTYTGDYNKDVAGEYTLTGTITLPENYEFASGVESTFIVKVTVNANSNQNGGNEGGNDAGEPDNSKQETGKSGCGSSIVNFSTSGGIVLAIISLAMLKIIRKEKIR